MDSDLLENGNVNQLEEQQQPDLNEPDGMGDSDIEEESIIPKKKRRQEDKLNTSNTGSTADTSDSRDSESLNIKIALEHLKNISQERTLTRNKVQNSAGNKGSVALRGRKAKQEADRQKAFLANQFNKINNNLWCDDCEKSFKHSCTTHGKFIRIKDKGIPSRARLTLPHQLLLKRIELRAGDNHVYGVFTRRIIQKRTQFGPYEGNTSNSLEYDREDRIKLKILQEVGVSRHLNCTDEAVCNWMMFVRPATSIDEQNMVAFQYRKAVYFVTTKVVASNEELRVWYAQDYAEFCGMRVLERVDKDRPPSPPSPFTEQLLAIDEEFLAIPSKKKSPPKIKSLSRNDTNVTSSTENLQTLADLALQPSVENLSHQHTLIPTVVEHIQSESAPHIGVVTRSVQAATAPHSGVVTGNEVIAHQGITGSVHTASAPHSGVVMGSEMSASHNGIVTGSELNNYNGNGDDDDERLVIDMPGENNAELQDYVEHSDEDYNDDTMIDDILFDTGGVKMSSVQETRTCAHCLQIFPLNEYYVHRCNQNDDILSIPSGKTEQDSTSGGKKKRVGKKTCCGHCLEILSLKEHKSHKCTGVKCEDETKEAGEKPDINDNSSSKVKPRNSGDVTASDKGHLLELKPKRKRVVKKKKNDVDDIGEYKTIAIEDIDVNKITSVRTPGEGIKRNRRKSVLTRSGRKTGKKQVKNDTEEGKGSELNGDSDYRGQIIGKALRKLKQPKKSLSQRRSSFTSRLRKITSIIADVPPTLVLMCTHCNKAFQKQPQLDVHMYKHTGERPYKCVVEGCGKAFITAFKLKRHETIHGLGKKYKCPYCDKEFGRKDHVKNHIKVHDPNKEMHSCGTCGKTYASGVAYKCHMAFHKAEEGELTCYVCSEEMESKDALLYHLKVHTGARSILDESHKKHKCKSCDKMFFTRKDVRRHSVVHTKERPHMCHLCPVRFGRKDHLARHLKKAHSGDNVIIKDDKEEQRFISDMALLPMADMSSVNVTDVLKQDHPKKRPPRRRKSVFNVTNTSNTQTENVNKVYKSMPMLLPNVTVAPQVAVTKKIAPNPQKFAALLPNVSVNSVHSVYNNSAVPGNFVNPLSLQSQPTVILPGVDYETGTGNSEIKLNLKDFPHLFQAPVVIAPSVTDLIAGTVPVTNKAPANVQILSQPIQVAVTCNDITGRQPDVTQRVLGQMIQSGTKLHESSNVFSYVRPIVSPQIIAPISNSSLQPFAFKDLMTPSQNTQQLSGIAQLPHIYNVPFNPPSYSESSNWIDLSLIGTISGENKLSPLSTVTPSTLVPNPIGTLSSKTKKVPRKRKRKKSLSNISFSKQKTVKLNTVSTTESSMSEFIPNLPILNNMEKISNDHPSPDNLAPSDNLVTNPSIQIQNPGFGTSFGTSFSLDGISASSLFQGNIANIGKLTRSLQSSISQDNLMAQFNLTPLGSSPANSAAPHNGNINDPLSIPPIDAKTNNTILTPVSMNWNTIPNNQQSKIIATANIPNVHFVNSSSSSSAGYVFHSPGQQLLLTPEKTAADTIPQKPVTTAASSGVNQQTCLSPSALTSPVPNFVLTGMSASGSATAANPQLVAYDSDAMRIFFYEEQ